MDQKKTRKIATSSLDNEGQSSRAYTVMISWLRASSRHSTAKITKPFMCFTARWTFDPWNLVTKAQKQVFPHSWGTFQQMMVEPNRL